MEFSHVLSYSTEGAPLFIGDVRSAAHWVGSEYDGSGVILKYFGQGLETLPKEYALTTKKGGERQKTFPTLEEADAFEAGLLRHLKQLHPTAERPARYADYPVYYAGSTRVFGIERQFGSHFASALKKLKGRASVIRFDRAHKAEALFFDPEGGGPGVIAASTNHGDNAIDTFVISKISASMSDHDDESLLVSLARASLQRFKPLGKLVLDSNVVIFDASLAASTVAAHNWGDASLLAGITERADSRQFGALRVSAQAVPGGAFLRVAPGRYNYAVVHNARAEQATYDALWIWRS